LKMHLKMKRVGDHLFGPAARRRPRGSIIALGLDSPAMAQGGEPRARA